MELDLKELRTAQLQSFVLPAKRPPWSARHHSSRRGAGGKPLRACIRRTTQSRWTELDSKRLVLDKHTNFKELRLQVLQPKTNQTRNPQGADERGEERQKTNDRLRRADEAAHTRRRSLTQQLDQNTGILGNYEQKYSKPLGRCSSRPVQFLRHQDGPSARSNAPSLSRRI